MPAAIVLFLMIVNRITCFYIHYRSILLLPSFSFSPLCRETNNPIIKKRLISLYFLSHSTAQIFSVTILSHTNTHTHTRNLSLSFPCSDTLSFSTHDSFFDSIQRPHPHIYAESYIFAKPLIHSLVPVFNFTKQVGYLNRSFTTFGS